MKQKNVYKNVDWIDDNDSEVEMIQTNKKSRKSDLTSAQREHMRNVIKTYLDDEEKENCLLQIHKDATYFLIQLNGLLNSSRAVSDLEYLQQICDSLMFISVKVRYYSNM